MGDIRAGRPALEAQDLRISLGGKLIVEDADLRLNFGELGVIAGPNGAGKSTLLRALLGLLTKDTGEVRYGGQTLDTLTRQERARAIAYVPQRSVLDAALRVEDVVSQGRFARSESTEASGAAADAAMERVGIANLLGRSFLTLSGGEQRLVLIARALCTEAPVLCLDEPTACLDIGNRLQTLALLQSLASDGRAVLCVLHDLEDVRRYADKVYLLHKGRMVCQGSAAEVITRERITSIYQVEMLEQSALGFRLRASP